MIEAIASGFGVFSDFWSTSWVAWMVNIVACGMLSFESFMLLHQARKRLERAAFGLVSLGAFAYFVGELTGEYRVVASVESVLHAALALAFALILIRRHFRA